jgi:hypothetical protein
MPDKLQELSENLAGLLDQLHVLIKKPVDIDFEIIENNKKEDYSKLNSPLIKEFNP